MSYPDIVKYKKNTELSDEVLREVFENTTVEDFLLCNPFTSTANDNYGGKITYPMFYSNFHVIGLLTYTSLMKVCEVARDNHKNTVYITGFRGSGKTTFANYIEQIINDEWYVDLVSENDFEKYYVRDGVNRKKCSTYSRIYSERFDSMLERLLSCVGENRNAERGKYIDIQKLPTKEMFKHACTCIELLNDELKGNCFRFNLETDIDVLKPKPISQKLVYILHRILSKHFSNLDSEHKNDMLILVQNVYENLRNHFISGDLRPYRKTFEFIINEIVSYKGFQSVPEEILDKHFTPYTLQELLGSIMLLDIFQLQVNNVRQKKIFYIFDNIDIIENAEVLHKFLDAYNGFVGGFNKAVNSLNKFNSENISIKFNFNFSADYCCVFFMRDTTARLINDHYRGRAYRFSTNFDISQDVDKGSIILRRYEYVNKCRTIINNPAFYEQITTLKKVFEDDYIRLNIAGLFNNDYIRFVTCAAEVCQDNFQQLEEYFAAINCDDTNGESRWEQLVRYGARGIVFRMFFEHFNKRGYLSKLGINESMYINGYTRSRLVLFFLYKKSPEHYSNFMSPINPLVTFEELKETFMGAFNDNPDDTLEKINNDTVKILADILWDLYDLKKTDTWAHLVTFDSLRPQKHNNALSDDVTHDDIKRALRDGAHGYVGITCAGRAYVEFMCSHFEFFSMRFRMLLVDKRKNAADGHLFDKSLFSEEFYSMNSFGRYKSNQYMFESLLEHMYEEFTICTRNLTKNENEMFKRCGFYSKQEVLNSPFIFQHARKGYKMRHLERVLQRMVTYMDSYRLFLVNRVAKNPTQVQNFNKKMLDIISSFVGLMEEQRYVYSSYNTWAASLYRLNIMRIIDTNCNNTEIRLDDFEGQEEYDL